MRQARVEPNGNVCQTIKSLWAQRQTVLQISHLLDYTVGAVGRPQPPVTKGERKAKYLCPQVNPTDLGTDWGQHLTLKLERVSGVSLGQ